MGLLTNPFENFVIQLLSTGLYQLGVYLPGVALSWVVRVFGSVIVYNDFSNESVINLGWSVLRDVGNMFFIIVLLVIAIGTIVKSSRYGYQQNLRRLVLMAVLINFSKTITLFFIELSQAVTLYFVSTFSQQLDNGVPMLLGIYNMLRVVKS